MELGLAGRTAVVSGASAGIGRAIALALAAEGAHVIALARREEKLLTLQAEAGADRLRYVVVDVTSAEAPTAAAAAIEAWGGRLDILVNSAGGSSQRTGDAKYTGLLEEFDIPDDVWDQSFRLNFHAARRLTEGLVGYMQKQQWGRIINLTGSSEPPGYNITSPAKAATHLWSKGLARTVARYGITSNCIAPGRVSSEQINERMHPDPEERVRFAQERIPMRRFGEASELAALATFLASEQAAYVTGTVINFDGGLRLGAL